jgi:hypothetical protein
MENIRLLTNFSLAYSYEGAGLNIRRIQTLPFFDGIFATVFGQLVFFTENFDF